jgi:hypothetical protein
MYYIIRIKGASWPLFDGYCKNLNDSEYLEKRSLAEAYVEVRGKVRLRIETLIYSGRPIGRKIEILTK